MAVIININVNQEVKKFSCESCDYKTNYKCYLNRHVEQVHDKIKDIVCLQCDYKCSSSSDLKQHVKQIHDKIKDVVCLQCDFKCSTSGNLKQHVKGIHTDPKPKNMTRGEKIIYDHLLSTSYVFKQSFFREATFNDLIGLGGNKLRFDFKVLLNDDKFVLIEFDGEQHFKPVNFGNKTPQETLDDFKKIRTHDRIKNDYCIDNAIPLLRIKYDQVLLIGVMINEFIRLHKIV